jgi:hypothetical protein
MVYDSLSKKIVVREPVTLLPTRDKVNLFNDLMDELGITARIQAEPDATARFQEIWKEQIDKFW